MHTICGVPVPEEDPKWSQCYAQYCENCADEKKRPAADNGDNNERTKKKRKKAPRPARPDVEYEDTPGTDATNWVFPRDKPQYLPPFLEFMRFIRNTGFDRDHTFTKVELLSLKPKHVRAFLTYKAFGKITKKPEDKPIHGRSNHIKNMKMKISHFMPSGAPWVDLPDGSGYGNPTRHKSINALIAEIIQFETRGEGSESRDVRDMSNAEFRKELELFREHKDPICRYRNPLIGIYQFHFITRADDVCNFKVSDPMGHATFDFALSQSVRWSKNVRDSRNCPDQLLLPSMEEKSCIFIALAIWLEYFLHNFPEAQYLMSDAMPPPNATKAQYEKFTKRISKTYRNRLESVVFKNNEFKSVYKGNDKRPLGLHSHRKMGSTQAKRRGSPAEHVDHRGRWVAKKGSRIVNAVYIDPEDMYADASAASNLCLGGPIKYKPKPAVADYITTEWLAAHVVPSIAKRKNDLQLVRNLGLAYLFVIMEPEMEEEFNIGTLFASNVRQAYEALPLENKPEQPVSRLPVHVYRIGESTYIEEVWQGGNEQQQPRQRQQEEGGGRAGTGTVADNLARVPASGGTAATQQVLQTLLIQNQQLQRELQDMENRIENRDQANRSWLEDKFRRLNNNIRRFGGTIQGGLVRQDPNRQAAVQRYQGERGPADRPHPFNHNRGNSRNRVWPTLCPNVNSLMSLWTEYEFGIGGRKAGKDWTAAERGNPKQKQTFYRRNCVWKIQVHLINKDHRIESANALILQTYGQNTSITNISKAVVVDRNRFKRHNGLHPNFR